MSIELLEADVLKEAIVPIQTLNLMNDVTYVEAARMLAERAMTEATASRDRVTLIFGKIDQTELSRVKSRSSNEPSSELRSDGFLTLH